MSLSINPQPSVLANLEVVDKPLPNHSTAELEARFESIPSTSTPIGQGRVRISRLPPTPSVPSAGPSSPSRYLFVAVRSGFRPGVYTDWTLAERQLIDHPAPIFKTFSTRLAAEAYVAGWDGAGRHSLPSSSPRPLREHLAMNFPTSVSSGSSSSKRPSYHARLLSTPCPVSPPLPWAPIDTLPDLYSDRPPLSRSSSSYRLSQVRTPSPLRLQVDDDSPSPVLRKTQSYMGLGGLLSPPASPENVKFGSVMDRERPTKSRSNVDGGGLWSAQTHRLFSGPNNGTGLGLLSPPGSPSNEKRGNLPRTPSSSGLWRDAHPIPSPPPSPSHVPAELDNAPKFSRSGLKKSNVVMPVAAPRKRSSLLSLSASPSSSQISLVSSSSTTSIHTIRKQPTLSRSSTQDRLASLSATSARELQLNQEGLQALDSLSPPRPAYMRQTSNSSLSSMSSLTSGTSSATTGDLREDVIQEEDDQVGIIISCTKSDGDADGSVDSSSLKSGLSGESTKKEKKKGGGLFKRFSKVLKLEKKDVPGQDRRPSV